MKKNINQNEIFDVVNAIRKYPQIFLLTDFVLGMPEDTMKSIEASCEVIEALDIDDIALTVATPYPGTELYEQCKKENLFFEDINVEELWRSNWLSHDNISKFVIKPYSLDLETLYLYRDKILWLRIDKMKSYHKRMREIFNI